MTKTLDQCLWHTICDTRSVAQASVAQASRLCVFTAETAVPQEGSVRVLKSRRMGHTTHLLNRYGSE